MAITKRLIFQLFLFIKFKAYIIKLYRFKKKKKKKKKKKLTKKKKFFNLKRELFSGPGPLIKTIKKKKNQKLCN